MANSFSIQAPPSSFLPPIKSLPSLTEPQRLHECIDYLRQIYVPNVRGSRRRKKMKTQPESDSSSTWAAIRGDPFERAYALRWLSALIRLESESDSLDLSKVQNDAAALLAICAGTASAGTFQRQFEFDGGRVKVVLNDVPLSTNASNGDYFGSVGAQTWGGACVLADEIAENPDVFLRTGQSEKRIRVLELGAGTGLVSLVMGKVSKLHGQMMDIISTDYYPSVLDNLKANIETNFPTPNESLTISSQFLDWSLFSASSFDSPLAGGAFDLVLGADIVYEPSHASWIHSVLEKTLRRPNDDNKDPGGMFHLVIPLRPSFAAESSTIEKEFRSVAGAATTATSSTGNNLVIFSKEIIVCDADEDGFDEDDLGAGEQREDIDGVNVVRYAYYVIGREGPTSRKGNERVPSS